MASLKPDPHQAEALSNIATNLELNDRATVVMACGTGKTLVALWAAEQSKAKSILVLVPSLTLLQQTLEEWSVHNSWGKDFSYLCVCSDPSVNLKNDEIEIDPSDFPFRIDTDPEIVKSYLAQNNGKTKIVFSTYQSSQVVSEGTKNKFDFDFDFAIFDEAHKTTGIADGRFALALKDENIKIKKRLFFTATPKHYDIKKRDKNGDLKFFSMDDESVYGKRAHTLTFSEAASKGIICPFKVVVTLIDKIQVDDFALRNGITLVAGDAVKAKWVASQIAVSSAIKHTHSTKVISFHSRVKAAQEFASDEAYGIKKFIEGFDVFHVHGKQKSYERKETISNFKNSPKSLITNAKCLTEGIDVPAVDMVVFFDPRHSKIDIAQAVGRAMRKPRGGNKETGYIVVPIYAESKGQESLQKAIKSEDFDDVALILNSLLEQDEELLDVVRELKDRKGRGESFKPKKLQQKIEVIGPLIGLDDLSDSIYVEVIERLGEPWYEWFGRLVKFKEREGHCRVPKDHLEDGLALGNWVRRQRQDRSDMAASLSESRIKILDELGFIWSLFDEKWSLNFEALKKFKEREGHCCVPKGQIENGLDISGWIRTQRRFMGTLGDDRKQRLKEIEFIFDEKTENWIKGFSILRIFAIREGHCRVPKFHTEGDFLLGKWVSSQRSRAQLPEEQKQLLEHLGLVLDKKNSEWEDGFFALKKFVDREGHCRVPKFQYEDDILLRNWIRKQRDIKSNLSEEQLHLLNQLSFPWDP